MKQGKKKNNLNHIINYLKCKQTKSGVAHGPSLTYFCRPMDLKEWI